MRKDRLWTIRMVKPKSCGRWRVHRAVFQHAWRNDQGGLLCKVAVAKGHGENHCKLLANCRLLASIGTKPSGRLMQSRWDVIAIAADVRTLSMLDQWRAT